MHAEYTIRAAKAGKHVLCEKPMSTSVADAEAMIAACKAANVKLMIAYRCHYEPTNLKAMKLIRDGALGQVQAIDSTFGFNIGPGEWRLSKKMAGGGPLLRRGHLFAQCLPLSDRRRAGAYLGHMLRSSITTADSTKWKRMSPGR